MATILAVFTAVQIAVPPRIRPYLAPSTTITVPFALHALFATVGDTS
jgi:hypothetical protein